VRFRTSSATLLVVACAALLPVVAVAKAKPLRLFWVDVEGGAATLVVTPAGESVLIDAGNPGGRDAPRIAKVAREAAGLRRIDHVVVTHFHRDHFGGVAELARLLPLGTLHERDLTGAPEAERTQPDLPAYLDARVERRVRLEGGTTLELRQPPGTARVSLEVLGADGSFPKRRPRPNAAHCTSSTSKGPDPTDNRNSAVLRLELGPFSFFDGGDLTWDNEARLVCPEDGTGGPVDVAQIDHHGLDTSNHPALFRTLRPAVVVVNNGPRKGNEPGTFAMLRDLPGLRAVYQLHRNLRASENNVDDARIANDGEDCAGHFVRLEVAPDGRSYEVWVPSTGHRARYEAR
jgi:beta-lactamase superfamily II metal-dependent hydrolase